MSRSLHSRLVRLIGFPRISGSRLPLLYPREMAVASLLEHPGFGHFLGFPGRLRRPFWQPRNEAFQGHFFGVFRPFPITTPIIRKCHFLGIFQPFPITTPIIGKCRFSGIFHPGFARFPSFPSYRIGHFRPFPTLSQGNGRSGPVLDPGFGHFPPFPAIEMAIFRLQNDHFGPFFGPFCRL